MPPSSDRPSHWDLMLEQGQVLRTWALAEPPEPGKVISAQQLADHRLAYLEREGEISGGRGHVERWDRGEYQRLADSHAQCWILDLRGQRVTGVAVLRQLDEGDQCWTFELQRREEAT
jgi:hypothetical protein